MWDLKGNGRFISTDLKISLILSLRKTISRRLSVQYNIAYEKILNQEQKYCI